MSLENEIAKLTAAIEKLNANMETLLTTPAPTVQPEPVRAELVTGTAQQPETSFKDVQDKCLALTRKDIANKATIRSLLDSFGASKVSDLGDKLNDFAVKLEQL